MARLHEFLTVRRTEIIRRWTDSINQTLAPAEISKSELVDHLPTFLDELTSVLRRAAVGISPPTETPTAARHGVQRLRLGFNLESLVREYGILHRCIGQLAKEDGLKIGSEDFDLLLECLITGIADAVTQYSEEREAERQRQSSEHFAFIAHELRNPLSTAMLALTLLRDKGLLTASRQGEMLERALVRMRDLIEQSLGLAITGAGIQLRRERVALHDLVVEASAEAVVAAEEKGVTLTLPSGGQDERLDLDRRLIVSALSNVLQNAVKFTASGGAVEVRWRRADGALDIEVEDECGGLPSGKIQEMFTPLVRAGADRTALGLVIARQAVEAHGGALNVRDLPGKGCLFTLQLPMS